MDADFDDLTNGGEALTFVDSDEDEIHAVTQDSTFDYNEAFSLPTQASQAESECVPGVESNADLTFQDVDDDSTEGDEGQLESSHYRVEHACSYCGISDPTCVAKCTHCSKWFCNGKMSTPGSHIINHFVRSGHKECYLHEDSLCGDNQLECYFCASRNIFNLGFIPAKSDATVMILCRNTCTQAVVKKDPNWLASEWKPLIKDFQLLSWICNVPSEEQMQSARKILPSQVIKLEDLWKKESDITIDDIDKPGFDEEPDSVLTRYDSVYQYEKVFKPLVRLEAEYDKLAKEMQTQAVGHVRWVQKLKKTYHAYFCLPQSQDDSIRLMKGDKVRLKHNQTVDGSEWKCVGTIIKLPDAISDEVGIETDNIIDKSVTESKLMFTCEFIWNGITYERQLNALRQLLESNSSYISQKLMGRYVDDIVFKRPAVKRFTVPGLPELNPSQIQAIKQVLFQPLSLIQGPPGTGKTVTCAAIVYHLVQQSMGQVLVCAPSNIAADHLAEKIHLTGLKVVRLCSLTREEIESNVSFLSLHTQLKRFGSEELRKLSMLKEEIGELDSKDFVRYLQLKRVTEHKVLEAADVICCTCSTAADRRLEKFKIKTVLIDESTQATEPEILVPIVRGVRQLILVGDHCQLGPVVLSKKAAKAGLQQSLFERFVLLGNRPFRLKVQYRMHPELSLFPSNTFYEGSLQNGVTKDERTMTSINFKKILPSMPTIFWSSYGSEEISSSGTSLLNRTEAANVEKLACKLINAGLEPSQIGIITPYRGQTNYIINYMKTQGTLNPKLYENIEIASVDAFQGREKDFIIVSCVRSNDCSGIGFLRDPRRLNVAITRAKYGLVIIGNAMLLSKHVLWNTLLKYYKDRGLIYEGPITNLRKFNEELAKPVWKTNNMFTAARFSVNTNFAYNDRKEKGGDKMYTEPENMLSNQSPALKELSSGLPIPLSYVNPELFMKKKAKENERKEQHLEAADLSQQFEFSQQQDQHDDDYEVGLSGYSQSQSQFDYEDRFSGATQPMSQNADDLEGVDRDMANLLLSQQGQ